MAPTADALGDAGRQRRRHPAERRTSRWSGLLLLAMIPQSAFGYALLGPGAGRAWVVSAHVIMAPLVILLGLLALRAARAIPWRGARERLLLGLAWPVLLLLCLQFVVGIAWRLGLLPRGGGLTLLHVGLGLAVTFLTAVLHVAAILPSILLSARKEHAELNEARRMRVEDNPHAAPSGEE